MRATRSYVTERFDLYNDLCFGGKLPKIPVRMSVAKGFLGKIKYKHRRRFFHSDEYYDFSLHINSRYDYQPDIIDDTIIHEMIHLYILYNGIKDNAPHGVVFKQIMNTINNTHNRHVSVSHKHTGTELDSDTRRKSHILCLSLTTDNRWCVTVCAQTRIFEIYRVLNESPIVKQMEWYYSTDPFFNRFPESRTAKLYKITKEEIDKYIENARRLECDGHKIYMR